MALVVEDGSIVAGANTYIDEDDANDILADFGLPDLVPATAEASLISAAQYLETFNYKGTRTDPSVQDLIFPRAGIVIDCFELPSDEIPVKLIRAQVFAASLIESGVSLYSNSNGQEAIEKTVDVITVKYAESGVSNQQPIFGQIQGQLNDLLKSSFTIAVKRA